MTDFIDRPSPNHDARTRPVSMVVLHYTDMLSSEEAVARLCDPEARFRATIW
jgi:N-acetylmuramoyl-L-alanine amidase